MKNSIVPRVLLFLEDNPEDQTIVRSFFEKLHCQVDRVPTGLAALQELTNPYDLFICNVSLSKLNGLDVAEIIRTHPSCVNCNIPIVMLVDHDDEKKRAEALKIKVNGFLKKPLTFELCSKIINELFLSPADKNVFLEN